MKAKLITIGILLMALLFQPNFGEFKPESLQEKQDRTAFQYQVTVVLKLVQVYVRDNKGNPITDLTKDDFILYDNGKLQTVTDFEKHLLKKPEKKVEEEIAATELPPASDVSSRMNRKFIFLLDIDRNDAPGVEKARKAALHFLDTQIQLTDEVGIFSYSRFYGLIIHEYFTSDHQEAREAIERIAEIPGIQPRSSTEITLASERAQAEAAAEGESRGRQTGAQAGESQIESSRGSPINFRFVDNPGDPDDIEHRTSNYISSIKELSKSLRYIPGYKNIILFSAGIPRSLLFSPHQKFRESYEEMAKELATSSSPVYTVNTRGLGRVQSLEMLSKLSGGKHFHNVMDYKGIAEQIQDATSNYYVLGYYISETWDGDYHEIKVKVKRKGSQVHAQQGYYNPKPFGELSEFERMLHLLDMAMGKNPYFQQPVKFNTLALPFSGKEEPNFVLLSEIPLDTISEIIRGKTELVSFIFNTNNDIVSSVKGDIDFSAISQKKIYHYTISSLRPGQYECRVVIRNTETGRAALASTSAEILKPTQSGIKLFPPLLIVPEEKSYYLRLEEEDKKKKTKDAAPSLSDIYPFLSNEHSPLVGDLEQGTPKLLAVVRSSVVDIQDPDIELTAFLFDYELTEKTPLPLSILASEKQKETDVLLCELQLPEMKPGKYFIKIAAEERKTGAKAETSQTFRVKSREK